MPKISDSQIAAYARQAGWSGNDLNVAVAVAIAESSGRTDVVNFLGCVGLWQVFQRVHARAHPLWSTDWLKNPANNAEAAHTIWAEAGNSWRPWTTYTSGAYQIYMRRARSAVGDLGDVSADFPGAGPIQTAGRGLELINKLRQPVVWRSIAFVIIGSILVIVALLAMSNSPQKIKIAKKVLTTVIPEGKAASVIGKVAA
jgi:hypothetical protein